MLPALSTRPADPPDLDSVLSVGNAPVAASRQTAGVRPEPDSVPPAGNARRRSLIVTALMALIVLVPSLWGFSGKFSEFIALYRGDVDGVFAISPIINYLLASLGFFCLFGWAMLHGMFHDIEGPKVTMLETEDQLDRQLEPRNHHHG